MNTTDFFLKYNKKQLDADGANGFQCVDVIKQYFKEVLNLPPFQGNAKDYWITPPAGVTKIPYQAGIQPNPGDIMVMDIPPYGHISICNWSRGFDFNAFEQNYPLNTPCHYQDHPNYKKVLGWLWPNHLEPEAPRPGTADKFVMHYTCFNADPVVMGQARQLMLKYSGGKIDVTFNFKTVSAITESGLMTQDEQMVFIQQNPFTTKFGFIRYTSLSTPNYDYMSTNLALGNSGKILTISEGGQPPFSICYEMTHAIQFFCQGLGFQMTVDDINTPDEAFLLKKLNLVLPLVPKLGGAA